MIVISSGKMQIPEEDRFIGFCGDNLHSKKQFRIAGVTDPDCIYRLYLSFDDGTVNYFVLDSKVENGSTILTWNILEEHIFKSGTVQAQIKCTYANGEIYHTTSDYFIVANSAQESDFFTNKENSEFLHYERVLNSLLQSVGAHENTFVPSSRKIADLSLTNDITADKLREALNVYPVLTLPREPNENTEGVQGQIAICGFANQPEFSIYYCCGETDDGVYTWIKVADIGSGNFVSSCTIAGLDLSGNISVTDLQTALSVYPVLTNMYEPPTTFKGETGQLCVGYVMTENPKLYMCFGKNAVGEYIWQLIGGGSGETDLSGYVPTTRTIADIDLSDDIAAYKMQEALNTYPVLITHTDFDGGTGYVGQLAVGNFYKDNPIVYLCTKKEETGEIDTPYKYTWVKIASAKPDINIDELKNSLEIEDNINNEILEFSKSAMPKTFFWEQGNLSATDGSEVEHTNRHRTGFIPIDLAFKYYLYISNSMNSTLAIQIYRYDENKNFISPFLNQTVPAKTQQTFTLDLTKKQSYVRFVVVSSSKDEFIRLYCKEQLSLATKKELRIATSGQPRTLSNFDYFGANKKVVIIGDSFSQGLGSTEFVSYKKVDSNGSEITVIGNGAEYGVEHNLPNYEIGTHIYSDNNHSWYEALDGNGWAQMLKNYLQNKFGCTVNNYSMSGFASGGLYAQTMNSSNTGLDLTGLETDENGNVRVYQALAKGFDTVFLTIGGNDRTMTDLSPFTYNVSHIIEGLLADNKNIILMSMTPCKDDAQMCSPMSAIDAALKNIAESYNLMFISNYQGMLDYCDKTGVDINTLRKDGLHPNDEGHAIVNSIICDALGIITVDKNYVDKALSEFKISDEDKLDIANMVSQMLSVQSDGDTNV